MYRSLFNLARIGDMSPAAMLEQANSSIVLVIPPAVWGAKGWDGVEVAYKWGNNWKAEEFIPFFVYLRHLYLINHEN